MFVSYFVIFHQIVFLFSIHLKVCQCWLFYSPASEAQTLQDCIHLKTTKSPFYPNYCDKLLDIHINEVEEDETTVVERDTTEPTSVTEEGWGWSEWSDWYSRTCPEVCGRRCKKRFRFCQGPFEDACSDGKPEELSSCDALNITSTTSATATTTESGSNSDDEYSMNMNEYEYDENGNETDKNKDENDGEENNDEDGDKDEVDEEDEKSNLKHRDRVVRKRRLRKLRKQIRIE